MSTLINNLKKAKYFTHGMIKLLPFMRTMNSNKLNVGSDEALKKHLFGSEANNPKRTKTWWEKPGIALMFQIEARPEWQWQRNYDQFNASITGTNGGVDQEGHIPQMKNWVAFSKRVGSDYHTFEAKWHDGLCYWNSQHTQWKTPVDYCWAFAKESRQAGIPYGFYYSSIFDHNPEFDDIQPLRAVTPSVIGMRGSKQAMIAKSYALSYFGKKFKEDSLKHLTKAGYSYKQPYPWYEGFAFNDFTPNPDRYLNYVIEQIEELCKDYGAELIWIDWYDPDNSGLQNEIMAFMKKNYPHTALTFNNTANANLPWVHYLSGEGHGFDKIWTMIHKFRQISRHWFLGFNGS
ncbi:MAG: alpha-L-fucosidase [Bacteroidota bacterium]